MTEDIDECRSNDKRPGAERDVEQVLVNECRCVASVRVFVLLSQYVSVCVFISVLVCPCG